MYKQQAMATNANTLVLIHPDELASLTQSVSPGSQKANAECLLFCYICAMKRYA